MIDNLLDPVVLFFALGVLAGVARSDLRLPNALYETLSVYLLLAIGLKGGVQLSKTSLGEIIAPLIATLALGAIVPLIAYFILRGLGRFKRPDAAAIAAHYGSVSAVTFAVCVEYLAREGVPTEEFVTVLLVVLEIPAIGLGILLARGLDRKALANAGELARELFFGRSIFLLIGGLLIGWIGGYEKTRPIAPLFEELFKPALALFLLEMGLVASRRLSDLKVAGRFLVGFGLLMPLFAGLLGAIFALMAGLSVGGATVLSTLAASASYIAAPAAMRMAVPEANPTLYLTASLGVTFPFNIIAGIPLYYLLCRVLAGWIG